MKLTFLFAACLVFSNLVAGKDLSIGRWTCNSKFIDDDGSIFAAQETSDTSADGSYVASGRFSMKFFDEYLVATEIETGYVARGTQRVIGSKVLNTAASFDVQSIMVDGTDMTEFIGRDPDIDLLVEFFKDLEGTATTSTILSLTETEFITEDEDGVIVMCSR